MKSKLLILSTIAVGVLSTSCKKQISNSNLTQQQLQEKMTSVKKMLQSTPLQKVNAKFSDRSLYKQSNGTSAKN